MEKMKFMRALWKKYPRKEAEGFDFIGLQIGKLKDDINKVLIALDYDESLLEITREFKPDLIITHHPFIFGKRSKVLASDQLKNNLVHELEDNLNIPIVSLHTNFDAAEGGMNSSLANKLDLINVYRAKDFPMMRIGELPVSMDIDVFVKYFMERANVSYSSLINEGKNTIKKIGFICGGGAGYYSVAQNEGCDIYISGDCPHHVRRDIIRYKMNYLDVPHEIERLFVDVMKYAIAEIDSKIEALAIDHEKEPIIYTNSQDN